MGSQTIALPYRYITWRMIEFQMDSFKLALRLFPGDLHRAVIFFLVARMSCADWVRSGRIAAPDCPTPFSINALAASLSRPFETVRRHVAGMIDDGICIRAGGGVALAPISAREGDIIDYYHDTAGLLLRLADRLTDGGVPLPRAEFVSDNEAELIVNAALDICLVALENNEHTHWFELALHGALIYENGRDIMGTPALAREYGNTVLPDELRRPVKIRALSQDYGIPYATVRRHVDTMMATGALLKQRSGYILNTQWTGRDDRIEQSNRTVDYLLRQFRTLAAAGVQLQRQAAMTRN